MMVMTRVSERPVTEPAGTIGAVVWLGSLRRVRPVGDSRPPAVSSFSGGRVRSVVCVGAAVVVPGKASCSRRGGAGCAGGGPVGLSYDPDMAVVQLQTRRLGLPHQLVVVRGDDDRGAEPV